MSDITFGASEYVDFIDVFEPEVSFTLNESSEVDGKHILAKVSGSFFLPDGKSRNGRFYPKELWENVLSNSDVKTKIKERRMYGTVGHEIELTDEAIGEGKASHIITDLQLNKDGVSGYGEAVILNTPYGRTLNTMLRAKSKLFVSSRAKGKFDGTEAGLQKVDPKAYVFKTFDFVTEPGFLEACPDLVEKFETKTKKGDTEMTADAKLLESLSKENVELREELKNVLEELKKIRKEKGLLDEKSTKLEETLVKENDKSELIAEYKIIGTPKEITEAFDKSQVLVEKYKVFGTPEEIEEAYDKVEETITKYKALGTITDLEEALDKSKEIFEDYQKLGTVDEVSKALDVAKSLYEGYEELGTPQDISRVFDRIEEYKKQYESLGSPEEISEVYDRVETLIEKRNKEKRDIEVSQLAEELSVPVESVEKVYESMTVEEITELFTSIKGAATIQEKYTKKETKRETKREIEDDGINPMSESRTSRLIKGFGR